MKLSPQFSGIRLYQTLNRDGAVNAKDSGVSATFNHPDIPEDEVHLEIRLNYYPSPQERDQQFEQFPAAVQVQLREQAREFPNSSAFRVKLAKLPLAEAITGLLQRTVEYVSPFGQGHPLRARLKELLDALQEQQSLNPEQSDLFRKKVAQAERILPYGFTSIDLTSHNPETDTYTETKGTQWHFW